MARAKKEKEAPKQKVTLSRIVASDKVAAKLADGWKQGEVLRGGSVVMTKEVMR